MSNRTPAYTEAARSGELARRARWANSQLQDCTLCPWQCHVNRSAGKVGQCRSGAQARVYAFMAHHGEENPLRGSKGSGTIFFAGCNMHCQFCQNADISQENRGILVDDQQLAQMMLDLQAQGCHNINLVSPTHVLPQILSALVPAAREGLMLPLVYNTGGYDSLESLQILDGIVDIYLPDIKYTDAAIAQKYSGIPDYPRLNQSAVKEMHRQVGDLQLDEKGLAVRGLLVRHLQLPDDLAGTRELMQFLAAEISTNTYVNIMDQYKPDYHARDFPELFRLVTRAEVRRAKDWAREAGLTRLE